MATSSNRTSAQEHLTSANAIEELGIPLELMGDSLHRPIPTDPMPRRNFLSLASPSTSMEDRSRPNIPSIQAVVSNPISAELSNIYPTQRLSPGGSSSSGVHQWKIIEFCEYVALRPLLATLPINELRRHKEPDGVRHEFIIVQSSAQGERPAVWLRLDRSAKNGFRINSTATKLVRDTVSAFQCYERPTSN